jgi:hypothetical protein
MPRTREGAAVRRRERRLAWTVRFGVWAVLLLGATWRIRRIHGERFDAAGRSTAAVVFAFWHAAILPLLYQHRGSGAVVLISEHRDGEIIARIAERLGFRTLRGSTSHGASRALIGLARALAAGENVAVTPDGPRGPARRFASGSLVAAQRAGAPVLPIGLVVQRAWRLPSWDGFMIPKPFSRVTIAYGEPTPVRGATPREAADEAQHFEALIADAERAAGG